VVGEDAGNSKLDTAARMRAACLAVMASLTIGAISIAGCAASTPTRPPLVQYSGSARPVEHVVRPGETVYHLAHVYGVSAQRLMEANHLSDSRDLRVGQSLLIPGSYSYASLGGSENARGAMWNCLLYTSPSPRDLSTSRMPSSA